MLKSLIKKYDFLIIIFIIYSLSLFLHFDGLSHDWPTMGDNYYDVTLSIVKGTGLNKTDIFNYCKEIYETGEELPLECKRHAFSQGINGIYPAYPPGLSFLAVPYFFIINLFGFPEFIELSSLVFFNIIISILIIFFIYKFSKLYTNEKNSKQIALIFAFGTIIWTYSQTFWSDSLAALLMISGFYYFKLFLMKKGLKNIAFSGLLFGYLFLTKIVLLVFPGIIGFYLLWKNKKAAIIFGLCALLTALPGLIYNHILFGSIMTTGYSEVYSQQFILSDASFAYFSRNIFIGSVVFLIGFFIHSPMLLYSIKNLSRKTLENKFLLVFFILTTLLFGMWLNHFGNWCFGPRLQLYMIVLLSIPFAQDYEHIKKSKYFITLIIISILITLLSQNFYFWDLETNFVDYIVSFY